MRPLDVDERRCLIAVEERALRAGVGGTFRLPVPKTLATNRRERRGKAKYTVLAVEENRIVVRIGDNPPMGILRGQRERPVLA